ncbi:MAG TPA: hypothetical protein VGN39_12960 [Terriglobales bacterium]|nr:hypothetical protein [Terriglobales bacterium]
MILTGARAHFWLSTSGAEALRIAIPKGGDFEALVVEEDGVGLWIWVPDAGQGVEEVTLLKWEYLAAVRLEYQPEMPQERSPAGFRRPS